MASMYALIILAFMNGEPVAGPIAFTGDEDHQMTAETCAKYAAEAVETLRRTASSNVQFVGKCVDLVQLPATVSAFGSKVR